MARNELRRRLRRSRYGTAGLEKPLCVRLTADAGINPERGKREQVW